uniref:SH3 domain-containing protein n=1 Tax=Timema shepardi TaxID=629360 RepID=A0A7R9AX78_TIMSH|nr:unnamed protein product [Timema shepardi]
MKTLRQAVYLFKQHGYVRREKYAILLLCAAPSSPVHNRRLLSARNMRMSSVELPDDNEKSLSSASTSPCPSPKPHRLLPTNLYVVLYNFKSRHPDELDLKAGYKVTVIDTTDPDWWKGKCLGRVGYFPSKYVIKLQPGERPLQVTHNLQVSDGDNGLMLLRDQIVIQVGEDLDGMVMIRSGDSRQGKFTPKVGATPSSVSADIGNTNYGSTNRKDVNVNVLSTNHSTKCDSKTLLTLNNSFRSRLQESRSRRLPFILPISSSKRPLALENTYSSTRNLNNEVEVSNKPFVDSQARPLSILNDSKGETYDNGKTVPTSLHFTSLLNHSPKNNKRRNFPYGQYTETDNANITNNNPTAHVGAFTHRLMVGGAPDENENLHDVNVNQIVCRMHSTRLGAAPPPVYLVVCPGQASQDRSPPSRCGIHEARDRLNAGTSLDHPQVLVMSRFLTNIVIFGSPSPTALPSYHRFNDLSSLSSTPRYWLGLTASDVFLIVRK